MSDTILEVRNICKEFPGVKALDNVSFDLRRGEVHVLLGENGAGKSTLMKVLTGVYHPDSGEIYLHGKQMTFQTPRDAQKAGIAIIFQEFNLAPNLTVAQNIYLGREPCTRAGFIDRAKLLQDSQRILDFLKVDIDPNAKVETLGIAHQQLVELAKALSIDSEILIMDEPTATLSDREINTLFDTIRSLQERGVSIIYISHRLQELRVIGNRITVLRDGQSVGTRNAGDVAMDDLIRMMVGRELKKERIRSVNTSREEYALEVENLSQGKLLQDISIYVQRGSRCLPVLWAQALELPRPYMASPAGTAAARIRPRHPRPLPTAIRQKMGFVREPQGIGLALNLPIRTNITHAGLKTIFLRHRGSAQGTSHRQRIPDKLRIVTPTWSAM